MPASPRWHPVGPFGATSAGARALDATGVLVTLVSTVPLVARRITPFTVYVVTCVASLVLEALRYPLELPIGPAIGAYSLAVAYGGAGRVRRFGALLAANLFVPAVAFQYAASGRNPADLALELLFWAAILLGAWIGGDRARLRRLREGELEQRALRAKRETERERRLAAAEERTRIARELHDSAGHAINVILVQAGAARLLHDRDPDGSKRSIATIEQVARDTIGEIDRLVRALRDNDDREPPPADPAAIEELLDRHRAGGLQIETELAGTRVALPRSVAWAGYRILQEALTNAARHGPGTASVAVSFQPRAVDITVTNPTAGNGSAPGGSGGGHGIVGMRERATLLGGSLEAAAGDGVFRVHARLPYTETAS
jgi:signal transduction histidine kinase